MFMPADKHLGSTANRGPSASEPMMAMDEAPVSIEADDQDKVEREYYDMGRSFLRRWEGQFHSLVTGKFAGAPLKFEIGHGFHIQLEKGIITLDVGDFKQWKEGGLTEWQIFWSVCHEIAHYRDLCEDPQGMLENFQYIRRKAREIAPKVAEIWRSKWGELPPHMLQETPVEGTTETLNGVEAWVAKQLHRNVYNALDDIYVNRLVEGFVNAFAQDGSQHKQVGLLYRDFLFPTDPKQPGKPPRDEIEPVDYAGMPLSSQLCDSLLRRAMVPQQAVLVSDRVAAVHRAYRNDVMRRVKGGKYDIEHETLGLATMPGTEKSAKARTRYAYYRELVEGHFIDLLLLDAEKIPPPPPPKKGGKPGDKPGKKGGDPSDDPWAPPGPPQESPIDEKTIRDFIKQKKDQEKKEKEVKKQEARSPEQREKDKQKELDKKFCEEHGIDPKTAEEYRRVKDRIQNKKAQDENGKEKSVDLIKELSRVFEQFMNDIERRIVMAWAEAFKKPGRLNIDRLVKKYGHYMSPGGLPFIPWEALDVYDRKEFTSRLKLKPSRIRMRLVLDGSGSMDESKLDAVKEVVVLMSEALSSFEAEMNLRFKLKEPFVVDTEVRMFGSTTEVVKPFAQGKTSSEQEWADRFKAFSQINGGWGGTSDCLPLQAIAADITPEYSQELESGSTVDMVVEVTDGETQTQPQTIEAIQDLEDRKMTTRCLLIGYSQDADTAYFDATWNWEPGVKRGENVHEIATLPVKMANLLAGKIKQLKAKIGYESEDIADEDDEFMGRTQAPPYSAAAKTQDQAEAERIRRQIEGQGVNENPFGV